MKDENENVVPLLIVILGLSIALALLFLLPPGN